ncbi:MAG: ComF family protein [Dethiobacter sp.]|jgi:ComF family protein|nr:ComF family protein [Dethiobacter sp.]
MGHLNPLFDLFFPPRCIFCCSRLEGEGAFSTCEKCLAKLPVHCCHRCGHPLPEQIDPCPVCRDYKLSFHGACAVDLYRGRMKRVVQKYKYGRQKHLAGPLGKLMARRLKKCGWPQLSAVVPVPLHRQRLLERGYDQSLLLAQVIGDELGLPVRTVLVRSRPTPSQTKLGHNERWQNVRDAFSVLPEHTVSGRLLLVDDLLTTGATAHFAAAALLSAGAQEVYLAVVGR